MRLYAISDLHLGFEQSRELLRRLPRFAGDWLIVAGDVSERVDHLASALELLNDRFERVIWAPGNHDLWTVDDGDGEIALRGQRKYERLVQVCRDHGVLTPEDPFAVWPGEPGPHLLAPLFTLYDYTFRPDSVPVEAAVEWAMDSGILCVDESHLDPAPHPSRSEWCRLRCEQTAARIESERGELPSVLISHWPLREDMALLPRIPRFSIWCGTRATDEWHRRYRASVVVSGHLHIRHTQWLDGVRFEEVSLGYPRQYDPRCGLEAYMREILPGPALAQPDGFFFLHRPRPAE